MAALVQPVRFKRGAAAGITAGLDGEGKWTTDTFELYVSQGGVLYRINWKHQGAWSGATAYIFGDVVEEAGSSYVCILGHTNHVPPNATYWAIVAEKGDPGDDGNDGADGLGFTLLGAWSGSTTYAVNDVVSLSGSSYACILAHTNHTPPNGTYWVLIASKGDTGATGSTGAAASQANILAIASLRG